MDWSLTHLEGLKDICKHQVQINQPLPPEVLRDKSFTDYVKEQPDIHHTISTTQIVPTVFTPEYLAQIEAASCLNECSANGKCHNGICCISLFYKMITFNNF